MRSLKANTFILPIILLLSSVFHILRWTIGHDWGGDFAGYLSQTVSLYNGTLDEFIIYNKFTIKESDAGFGPIAYPWGFPALLLPAYSLFGLSMFPFKLTILFCFICFLVVIWKMFEQTLSRTENILMVSLFAFNPLLLSHSDSILSDTPFLLFSTLSIYLMQKLLFEKPSKNLFIGLALGLFFSIAVSIRSNGILLPITYCLVIAFSFLLKKGSIRSPIESNQTINPSKHLLVQHVANLLLPLAVFLIIQRILLYSLPYSENVHLELLFSNFSFKSFTSNVVEYSFRLKDFFGTGYYGMGLYLLSLPFFILGIKRSVNQDHFFLYLIYTFLIILLLLVWPFTQGIRFLFPLLPFYLFYVFLGLRIYPKKITHLFPHTLLLLIFTAASTHHISLNLLNGRAHPDGPYSKEAIEMFHFIQENTPLTDSIIFRKPRVLRLYTERNSFYPKFTNIDNEVLVDWYVNDKNHDLDNENKALLITKLQTDLVFENGRFMVFRILN